MKGLISLPFDAMAKGGLAELFGFLFLLLYLAVLYLALRISLVIVDYTGVAQQKTKGRVLRKYVTPRRRELHGRFLVTVEATKTIDIDVNGEVLKFSPPDWKYEKAMENSDVDVLLKRARISGLSRIEDIGPF